MNDLFLPLFVLKGHRFTLTCFTVVEVLLFVEV